MNTVPSPFYELIDSGDQKRLERFGDRVLIRPSKFSVWKPRASRTSWDAADASYVHKAGWKFKGKKFEEWVSAGDEFSLKLRLQDSGQVGFFPEHMQYLPDVRQAIKDLKPAKARVLNLFAYTGMASVAALQEGADVTHVDLSKKALDWAKENFELNKIPAPRFIREDAVSFMEREVRRGSFYDIVIADPPSFSRVSDKEEWSLEDILGKLITLTAFVTKPESGAVFLTSHHFESGGHVMANLFLDASKERKNTLITSELTLKENGTGRILPAGFLVSAKRG